MKNTIETIEIEKNIKLSGYAGEYVFEKIKNSKSFYEEELLNKCVAPNKNKYKVIYDIGANIGNHTVYFAHNIPNVQIFSFEPMKENYELLKRNVIDNFLKNVKTFNFALGAHNMKACMKILIENNNGSASMKEKFVDGEKVKVRVIDELKLSYPDFVKIDVEGYEVEVLKGMKNLLDNCTPDLWIEVDTKNAISVITFLSELGYCMADCELRAGNNILFKKNADANKSNIKLFQSLLEEADQKRDNWLALGKKISEFTYEQKKANELKRKLSDSEWRRKNGEEELKEGKNKVQELSDRMLELSNNLEKESKKANDNLEKFKSEQKRANDNLEKFKCEQKRADELQSKLDMYKKSKLFKLLIFKWKLNSNIRFYGKKKVYILGNKIYIKLIPHPRLRSICTRINNKLKIFKDTEKVKTYEINSLKFNNKAEDVEKKTAKQLNVAMIVDEFTYNSFKFECNALPIEPSNWQKIFRENHIDMLFCESAWSGVDSVKRPWKGQVYSSINFKNENRGVLLSILEYCNKNNIPTVFWNKEDPTHYDDKVHNFVDTAIKFDYIFTTDCECVERYKNEYGHKNVYSLMFATQPKLFNPIEKYNRTDEIIFAGSWYKEHPNRCIEMGGILDNIIKSNYKLKIYNRYSDSDDPNHIFPERFKEYLNPCLSHAHMDVVYKSSKYALNINTVTRSDTMFARRVFELMSSNTLVLSNYSKGMEELFGNNVIFINGEENIDLSGADEKRINCLYNVLKYHTYSNRFSQILNEAGIDYIEEDNTVAIIYRIANVNDAEKSYNHFISINYKNKKAYFFLKEQCDLEDSREILVKYESSDIMVVYESYYKKYGDNLKIECVYFAFANTEMDTEFINKAVLHYEYIDEHIGISNGGDFKIIEKDNFENVLFNITSYEKVRDAFINESKESIMVYGIK